MASNYKASNWYWIVGGSTTQVFSSASFSFVPLTDSTYVAWSATKQATKILNGAELYDVLVQQVMPSFFASGVALTSTGTPSLNATYPLDPQSQFQITSISTGIAAGKSVPGGGATFVFNGITFTAAQFLNVASALEDYVYNVGVSLTTLLVSGEGLLPVAPITIA